MKGLGLQRRIFSLGEVSEPTNSKGLLGGEEAFSNEKRQGWKPVSSLKRGIYPLRLALLAVSVMVIYGLFYFFVHDPLHHLSIRLTSKILELEHTLHDLQAEKKRFDQLFIPTEADYESQIRSLKEKIDVLDLSLKDKRIPNPSNFKETIAAFSQPGPSLTNPDIEELPLNKGSLLNDLVAYRQIELTLYGSYFATIGYLHSLEALPCIAQIDSFTYTVTTYPYAKIHLVLSVLSSQGLSL